MDSNTRVLTRFNPYAERASWRVPIYRKATRTDGLLFYKANSKLPLLTLRQFNALHALSCFLHLYAVKSLCQ